MRNKVTLINSGGEWIMEVQELPKKFKVREIIGCILNAFAFIICSAFGMRMLLVSKHYIWGAIDLLLACANVVCIFMNINSYRRLKHAYDEFNKNLTVTINEVQPNATEEYMDDPNRSVEHSRLDDDQLGRDTE